MSFHTDSQETGVPSPQGSASWGRGHKLCCGGVGLGGLGGERILDSNVHHSTKHSWLHIDHNSSFSEILVHVGHLTLDLHKANLSLIPGILHDPPITARSDP